MAKQAITINRAPVLTLWATVVAERLGFDADEALTLGKALAGLNAQSKGRALGIFKPRTLEKGKPRKKHGLGEELWVELCGRPVPAKNTSDGVRAVVKDQPIRPQDVRAYLERSFKEFFAECQLSHTFTQVDPVVDITDTKVREVLQKTIREEKRCAFPHMKGCVLGTIVGVSGAEKRAFDTFSRSNQTSRHFRGAGTVARTLPGEQLIELEKDRPEARRG